MCKKIFFIVLFFMLLSTSAPAADSPLPQTQGIKSIEPIQRSDSILILAPHPDDETIGCAGVIQQAIGVGAKVIVAYLTNGDHNQIAFIVYEKRITITKGEFIHMGEVRRQEAIKAMKLLGVNEKNLIFLGYPDFGTFTIFSQYWQTNKSYRSLLTRISSVPYKENFSFGSPYMGEAILGDLKKVLLTYRPTKIFVSHPADTNVDHRALYLFLQIALCDLNKELPSPKIYPYLIHCIGWPLPRHYHPELSLKPPHQFLNSEINWSELQLTAAQLNKKYQAILCNKSQTQSSAFYLLSFARKNELFGDYPDVYLKRQALREGDAVTYSGPSDMFPNAEAGALDGLESIMSVKGQVSFAVEDDAILIRIEKAKDSRRKFSLMLYLFGYNYKTPFEAMPKIRIITRNNRFKVFDQKKMINPEGITLESSPGVLILRVPLQVLGNPEFILTSMKAYSGFLPVDIIGFRRVDIK